MTILQFDLRRPGAAAPLVGAAITAALEQTNVDGAATYTTAPVTVTTSASGTASMDLWPTDASDTAGATYVITIRHAEIKTAVYRHIGIITSASPIQFADLLAAIDPGAGFVTRPPFKVIQPGYDGVVGDGIVNDTAAIQLIVNAHRGRRIVFSSAGRYRLAGLLLSGATFDGTELDFAGEMVLAPAPSLGANNFINVWGGLILQGVAGATVSGRFNGNRAQQQNREQTICIVVAGCAAPSFPVTRFREIRGDGIYVSQALLNDPSTRTTALQIGAITGANSVDDGRNLISIIDCDGFGIGAFNSVRIGGIIAGAVQPGGLNIEPSRDHQAANDGAIGSVAVMTAGTNGITIVGRDGTRTTRDITIGSATVVNTTQPHKDNDAGGPVANTDRHVAVVISAANVVIGAFSGRFANAYGDGVIVSDADGVQITGKVSHVREGARIGNDDRDVAGTGVTGSTVDMIVTDTNRFGFRTGKVSGSTIAGLVSAPVAGHYNSSISGVVSFSHAQDDVTYSVSVGASTTWAASYRNDTSTPAALTNCRMINCSLSGAWAGSGQQAGAFPVLRQNVAGITEWAGTSPPSVKSTHFTFGQRIYASHGIAGYPRGWTLSTTNSAGGGTWVSMGNL